jgi:hypothetical protein
MSGAVVRLTRMAAAVELVSQVISEHPEDRTAATPGTSAKNVRLVSPGLAHTTQIRAEHSSGVRALAPLNLVKAIAACAPVHRECSGPAMRGSRTKQDRRPARRRRVPKRRRVRTDDPVAADRSRTSARRPQSIEGSPSARWAMRRPHG